VNLFASESKVRTTEFSVVIMDDIVKGSDRQA
jgi:hypothetical protein